MLRVLLVDDEPFIVQGLMVFVDWEQEGMRLYILLPMEQKHLHI